MAPGGLYLVLRSERGGGRAFYFDDGTLALTPRYIDIVLAHVPRPMAPLG